MSAAWTSIATDLWSNAGSMLSDMSPILGIFLGLGAAIFVAGAVVSIVRGRD